MSVPSRGYLLPRRKRFNRDQSVAANLALKRFARVLVCPRLAHPPAPDFPPKALCLLWLTWNCPGSKSTTTIFTH